LHRLVGRFWVEVVAGVVDVALAGRRRSKA